MKASDIDIDTALVRYAGGQFIKRSGGISMQLGRANLKQCPEFLGKFFDQLAGKHGCWESYERFIQAFNYSGLSPRRDDPFYLKRAKGLLRKDPPQPPVTPRKALETLVEHLYVAANTEYLRERQLADHLRRNFQPTSGGYADYIRTKLSPTQLSFLSQSVCLPIPEALRERHTILLGGSGSGKSELIKTMIHHTITSSKKQAVVLIDPHGLTAESVARFPEVSDRLVYLDLKLSSGLRPILNPFDVPALDDEGYDIVAQQIIGGLGAMLSENNTFTDQMVALLRPCVQTLLRLPGATMEHLKQFLDDDRNRSLLDAASRVLHNPNDLDFLRKDFSSPTYAPTKQGIRTRLHLLLTQDRFRNFLIGEGTFHLKDAIKEGKVIIFKLTKQTDDDPVTVAIGRLIVASLLSLTMPRGELGKDALKQETPIHLFIDEAHNFTHPSLSTVLSESRKFLLYLTLATQSLGKFQDTALREDIETNTGIKISGRQNQNSKAANTSERLIGLPGQTLDQLQDGQFFIKCWDRPSFHLQNGMGLLGFSNSVTDSVWSSILSEQHNHYYRPVETPEEARENYSYQSKASQAGKRKPLN